MEIMSEIDTILLEAEEEKTQKPQIIQTDQQQQKATLTVSPTELQYSYQDSQSQVEKNSDDIQSDINLRQKQNQEKDQGYGINLKQREKEQILQQQQLSDKYDHMRDYESEKLLIETEQKDKLLVTGLNQDLLQTIVEEEEKKEVEIKEETLRRWNYINFCKRLRAMRKEFIQSPSQSFRLKADLYNIQFDEDQARFQIHILNAQGLQQFLLTMRFSGYGIINIIFQDINDTKPRFAIADQGIIDKFSLFDKAPKLKNLNFESQNNEENQSSVLIITADIDYLMPTLRGNVYVIERVKIKIQNKESGGFTVQCFLNDEQVLSLNDHNLLSIEEQRHVKARLLYDSTKFAESNESLYSEAAWNGLEEEIPNGPQAIALDINYPKNVSLYGIPERINSFNLKNTLEYDDLGNETWEGEPYRLYTSDHFEDRYNFHSVYGAIPLMISKNQGSEVTTGVFWSNSSDTLVDIFQKDSHRTAHWMSETGQLEIFLLPSSDPRTYAYKLKALNGGTFMPALDTLGYHQCRWNYNSQQDVLEVSQNMSFYEIPCDHIWLDIEYSDEKRYYLWDKKQFPKAKEMVKQLKNEGRGLVTIIDPHVKQDEDYFIYKRTISNDLIVTKADHEPYVAWCWPRNSVWIDYMNPEARKFVEYLYEIKPKPDDIGDMDQFDNYIWDDDNVQIWNDMNEPACFDKYEKSMPKSNLHKFGHQKQKIEHREVHNTYGYYNTMATYEGLMKRGKQNKRAFVLTRSFFLGSQKYAAVWTGDCKSDWAHFNLGIPMLLQNSICGISFVGSDVPGFFFDPEDEELVVRWYQLGAMMPFYRAHAHEHTKRREPWTFSKETLEAIRNAINLRYRFLPYIYLSFYESYINGQSAMRPMWQMFPLSQGLQLVEDQYMLGDSILIKPSLTKEQNVLNIKLPDNTTWFNYFNNQTVTYDVNQIASIKIDLNSFGMLVKVGTILCEYHITSYVRSTKDLKNEFVLKVYLDEHNQAEGYLYVDDYTSMEYQTQVKQCHKYQHFIGQVKPNQVFVQEW
eukprot:403336941